VSDSQGSERDFERLSRAITDAVMNSEKVKKVVAEIQKKEKICPQSFMVLVLKMQVLTESLGIEIEEDDLVEKGPLKSKDEKKSEKPQYVDGRRLSKNEIKFQEYTNKQFDTESWLKRNGLIL
jgi:hypothetical protein